MINNREAMSMAEASKYLHVDVESEAEVLKFIKKFVKISPAKAEELKKELESLDMMKMRQEHIIKIIDLLPNDKESLNKIFNDVSLDEDETNKLLETIKKFE